MSHNRNNSPLQLTTTHLTIRLRCAMIPLVSNLTKGKNLSQLGLRQSRYEDSSWQFIPPTCSKAAPDHSQSVAGGQEIHRRQGESPLGQSQAEGGSEGVQ